MYLFFCLSMLVIVSIVISQLSCPCVTEFQQFSMYYNDRIFIYTVILKLCAKHAKVKQVLPYATTEFQVFPNSF